jgi:hypothetical protein
VVVLILVVVIIVIMTRATVIVVVMAAAAVVVVVTIVIGLLAKTTLESDSYAFSVHANPPSFVQNIMWCGAQPTT